MTQQERAEQKTIVAFIAGLLIGGLLVWMLSGTPDPGKEVTVQSAPQQVEQQDTKRSNYAYCFRASNLAQNPDFWTGELQDPYTQLELKVFMNDCLRRITE